MAGPAQRAAEPLWSPRFLGLLGSIGAMFLGVALLLPIVPFVIERESDSSGQAGLATTLFFGATVLTQLATPRLLVRLEARALAVVGLVLLGAFSLVAAVASRWEVLSATMIPRGVGFGLVTVVVFTIVPHITPESRRAEALGLCGLAIGIPNVFGPSLGLWWASSHGHASVLALAGVVSLLAIVPLLALPRRLPRPRKDGARLREAMERPVIAPFLALAIVTVTFGAIVTFVPVILPATGVGSAAVFLLCSGTAGFVARWVSGRIADRVGPARVLPIGFVLLVLGLAIFAAGRGSAGVAVAGVLFGGGFGTVQTGLQAEIFRAAGPSRVPVASMLWNIGLDAGVGLGALVLGVVAATAGYDAMLWTLPLIAGLAFVVFVSLRGSGRAA